MTALSDSDIDFFIQNASFPESIIKAHSKVAIVLTQDWCHEWADMQSYLPKYDGEVKIFYMEYNKLPKFEEIMSVKENKLGNRLVPYLLYFNNGQLITATNWIPERMFQTLLEKEKPFKVLN